jgi:hypothetical protein
MNKIMNGEFKVWVRGPLMDSDLILSTNVGFLLFPNAEAKNCQRIEFEIKRGECEGRVVSFFPLNTVLVIEW